MPTPSFPLSLSLSRGALLAATLLCLPVGAPWAQTAPALVGVGTGAITTADVLAETMPMDETTRANLLSTPDAVLRLATDLYVRRHMSEQAVVQKLDQQPEVQSLLQIVRERVLSDALGRQTEAQSRPTEPVLEKLALQNYQAMPQRFQQPERAHVRHILIPVSAPDARAQAEALRQQLQQGASFEELARKHSKDPGSAPKGGDLGFITPGRMVAPFEEAAFALEKPGQLSAVVETRFGFHVIELMEKRPAGLQPFEEVKTQLVKEAAGGVGVGARQELVRSLLEAAKTHPETIEAFSATYR